MVIDSDRIVWIGDEDGAGEQVGARVVDLAGGWVTPAFVDAHVHTTATGLALTGLDLSDAPTLAAALDAVERAARSARGRPVLGSGWDDTRWPEQRPPTARELDRASWGGVVYLARVDAHSAVVSSALAASVPGLPRYAGYGPDGLMRRDAHDAVRTAAFAALSVERIRELQRTALRTAAALGIARVHEMAGPAISSATDLQVLLELAAVEPLPEVLPYWGELFGIEAAHELGAVGAAGDLFCDGSLGSHTAALGAPYADRPETSGALRFDTADLAEHIVRCARAGLQSGFHVIGDAAVDQALEAYELAGERLGRPAGPGNRLEHVEYVRDPARLARTGLLASMQPMFDASWGGAAGMYATRLGPARAARLNRFGELAAAGVRFAFGSDAPVTDLGPWQALWAAVTPTDPDMGLSVEAAFAASTDGAELVPSAPASFAVWASRPGDGQIPDCLATVGNGAVLHDRGLHS